MFEAQYFFTIDETGESIFGPWFPRGGDAVRTTLDVVQISTNASLRVELFTKNSEETTDGADADTGHTTNITATTAVRTTEEWSRTEDTDIGLKELIRYKFTLTSTDGGLARVLFRMLPPVWFDAVLPQP